MAWGLQNLDDVSFTFQMSHFSKLSEGVKNDVFPSTYPDLDGGNNLDTCDAALCS